MPAVTLPMAKAQCSIHTSDTTWDDLLPTYIAAAIDYVETETGHILEAREITESFDAFGSYLELSYRPVTEVTEIGYVDGDEADQTFAGYRAQLGRFPVRVYPASGEAFPTPLDNAPITVTYSAGYPAGQCPAGLVQACLLLIGHWYLNRETAVVGVVSNEVQFAVEALCSQRRAILV